MFNKNIYTERRKQLKQSVGTGILLFPGNEESSMNYKDNVYQFRQDSCFLYYTGIDRPNLFFILDIDNDREILFGDEATIEDIIWTGPVEAIALQAEKAGISTAKQLRDISAYIKQYSIIHYTPPYRAETALKLSEYLGIPLHLLKEKASVTLIKAIVAQRSVKTGEEIVEIEKGVAITAKMQLKAMELAKEGMSELAIAGQIQGLATSEGGQLAFPTILTVNGQFLHNHAGPGIIHNGQMVLCDCGAESSMHYAGDMTRTFPVSGKFTAQQKELYQVVLNANEAAIAALRPGIRFIDVHLLASEKLAEGLKDLGIMKGNLKEAVQEGAHALFFQCGLGHMMGLDVHDMENLGEEYVGYTDQLKKSDQFGLKSLRLGRELETGFVVTIEPGLYFVPDLIDAWQAENKHDRFIDYGKLDAYKNAGGIRIEDDLFITEISSRLLGSPLIKSLDQVSA